MGGYEARRFTVGMDIPCGADIQDGIVRRNKRAVHRVADAVTGFTGRDHLVLVCMAEQSVG